MYKRLVPILLVCAVALLAAPVWAAQTAAPAGGTAVDAAEAAVAYANALAVGNTARAWNLLAAPSRQGLTQEQWSSSFEHQQATTRPPATSVLRALAASSQVPTVGGVLVRGDQSLINVSGAVQITQTITLRKEAAGWRVDLATTDKANSQEAAQAFLAAVREDVSAGAPQPRRAQEASLPLLQALLRSEARDYHVLRTDVNGDRATVVVASDVPVNLVLRAARSGAGWAVDLARPLAPVDILSTNPLQEAAAASERQSCEDQLRQLSSALQMYAGISDDMLPDPKRWVDQISRFLPPPANLHCASDPMPGPSYAFNSNLAGKRRREIGNPSAVPLIFESTAHKANAADTGQSWPATPWHTGGALVLYADGSIRQTATKPSFEVPPAPPGGARPMVRPGARPGVGPGMPNVTVTPRVAAPTPRK